MTRAELSRIRERGRLFCGFWEAGYFLNLSWNQVDHLYESGRLPKALCPDGSEYRPAGERLLLVEKLESLVAEPRGADFAYWRAGGFEIVPGASRDARSAVAGQSIDGTVETTDPLTVSPSGQRSPLSLIPGV